MTPETRLTDSWIEVLVSAIRLIKGTYTNVTDANKETVQPICYIYVTST